MMAFNTICYKSHPLGHLLISVRIMGRMLNKAARLGIFVKSDSICIAFTYVKADVDLHFVLWLNGFMKLWLQL